MQPCSREMQSINSILNQTQISSLLDLQQNGNHPQYDTTHDEFLDQMLSSIHSSWPPDLSSSSKSEAAAPWELLPQNHLGSLEDQSNLLASKLRQHQIGSAKALMHQQQLMLSRGLSGNGLRSSPTEASGNGGGFLPMALNGDGDHNGVCIDASPFDSANSGNDASVQDLYHGLGGSLGQPSNQPQQFHHPQGGGIQAHTIGAGSAMNHQTMESGSTGTGGAGGAAAAQPKQQRVRARRGQATDPHSIAERLRRERIAERMKALQELVPNANKTDKASMLDEIIDYVKFLQLQVKVLSMSRLGGAAAVPPLVADISSEAAGGVVGESVQGNGRSSNGTKTASSSNGGGGMTVTEHQVAKLMEEDMGSAMQYLQGKGLCLMPISLATAISTATCQPRSPALGLLQSLNGVGNSSHTNNARLGSGSSVAEGGGPSSPNMSVLAVQSATLGSDPSVKDAASVAKP